MWIEYKEYISFFDAEFDKGKMYLCNNMMNGLFEVDLVSFVPELIGFFNDEKLEAVSLCRKIKKYADKIFFFPGNADSIVIYDQSCGMLDSIKLRRRFPDPRFLKTIGYIERNEKIFLMPALAGNPLVIFDYKTEEVTEINDWKYRFFDLDYSGIPEVELISMCIDLENVSLLRINYSDYWIRKDWTLEKSSILQFDNIPERIMFIVGEKGTAYGIGRRTKELFVYDDYELKMNQIAYSLSCNEKSISGWQLLMYEGGRFFLLENDNIRLFEWFPDKGEIVLFTELERSGVDFPDYRSGWPDYWGYKFWNNKLFLFPYGSAHMAVVELADGSTDYHIIKITDKEIKNYITEMEIKSGQVLKEETDESLRVMIRVLNSSLM